MEIHLSRNPKPELKQIGGSDYDAFNQVLADQTMNALWLGHSDDPARQKQALAATAALMGGKPRDELEGMLVSQMVACHAPAWSATAAPCSPIRRSRAAR